MWRSCQTVCGDFIDIDIKKDRLSTAWLLGSSDKRSGWPFSKERWFAVGIYVQKMAEAAVCSLPQVELTDVVFAGRKLKPAEIEMLALRRGQVVQCSVGDEVEPFSIGSLQQQCGWWIFDQRKSQG